MADARFSVVIPTCGRPAVLAATLDRLTPAHQGVPDTDFEIVVADDSRDDETERLVGERYPRVRYVRGPRRGPASNRNVGAAHASGDWLAFVDDDCQPARGWLAALCRAAEAGRLAVLEGRIVCPERRDTPFVHGAENLTGGVYWSGNLAIRRDLFIRLGGFDEDFTEAAGDDLEFAERIRRSGAAAAFCPDATVIHPAHRASLGYILWHAFTLRWHLLYLLKTGQGIPLGAPWPRALAFLAANRSMNLLRLTWQALRTAEGRRRTAMFQAALSWALFPVMLPYLACWDVRFRRLLAARAGSAVVATSRREAVE
jgi:GT2 family glycosyltransferase